eukprot:591387-Rhodomonas_salina.2
MILPFCGNTKSGQCNCSLSGPARPGVNGHSVSFQVLLRRSTVRLDTHFVGRFQCTECSTANSCTKNKNANIRIE